MSNADAIRAMWDAFRRRDVETQLAYLDPEIVWDATQVPMPDIADVYHGTEGVMEFWRRWLAAWEAIDIPDPDITERGDKVLVWVDGQVNRGRASGIEVRQPPFGFVWTFRDGKAVALTLFADQAEARSAAGLE